MGKVKYRSLRELYVANQEKKVVEPTKDLHQGSLCTDQFDMHFTSSTFKMGEGSRTGNLSSNAIEKAEECSTCNAPASPCLSHMHLEHVLSPIKADVFSNETCNTRAAFGSSSLNSGCNKRQLTSSDISNDFGTYWTHDSLPKDIGLKATSRSTDVSENIDRLLKANTCPPHEGKREQILNPRIYTNKLQKQKDIISLRDLYASASLIKGEPSNHPEKLEESSLIEVATFRLSGRMQDVDNHAESMIDGSAMNDRNPVVKAVLCSDLKNRVEKSSSVADVPSIQEPPLQSQLVDYNDNSLTMEVEVKICDICGDSGREELLAICSRCSDGAEHIYCMHVMLDRVPEANWRCEECMLGKQIDEQIYDEIVNVSRNAAFRINRGVKLNLKGSAVKEVLIQKANSTLLSAKKPARNLESAPVKKGTFETSIKSSRTSRTFSRSLLHEKSSFKNSCKTKIKPALQIPSLGDQSSDYLAEDECLPAISGHRPSKVQPLTQLQKDLKLKSQPSNDVDQKQILVCDTASMGQRKEGVSRKICISLSYKNDVVHSSNAAYTMVKRPSPSCSHAENLKRSGHTTECKSTQGKHTSELHPTVSSPVADSGISSLSVKEIASCSENFSSGSNCHDLEAIQGHEQSHNSMNPFSHLAQQGVHSVGCDDVSQLPVVPQLHYLWQGGFQICRNKKLPSSCTGVQAHLSTCALPKVFDVVLKLPQKVILEEVPRLSTWPTQFSENLATEDNIALYFFAKDLLSYETNYKSLLECMINNDLALKGNLDGVELLIFSSNILPEKSWRWNKLYFLWGVFRERRVCCSQDLESSQRIQEIGTMKQEMDLKRYFQERGGYNVDQERECKRIKSCYSMPSGEGLPSGTNGYVPTFSIENLRWGGGVNDMSTPSVESQIPPTDGEYQSEPGDLDLELCLGAKNKSKKQVAMPSFLDQDKHSELLTNKNTNDEVSTSLSLSLPFSNKEV